MMPQVYVRLFQELNDYLPPESRPDRYKTRFACSIDSGTSVRALIESLGIPVDEVDLVTVDGESVPLTFRPAPNVEINVYPVFERFGIGELSRVRSRPLRRPRFVLDQDLDELARRLRERGLDAVCAPPFDHDALIARSREEHRILLSRDQDLTGRPELTHCVHVRGRIPEDQLNEVLDVLDLR